MKKIIYSIVIVIAALHNVNAQAPPAAPIANAATIITSSAYYNNWDSVATATGYELDVATDNAFTNIVSGYQAFNVGNVLIYNVNTNLTAGTTYYYRIRAFNANGVSENSNTVDLITIPTIVTLPVAENGVIIIDEGTAVTFNVNVTDASDYQWRRDGENLIDTGMFSGATTNSLSLINASGMYTGSYDCVLFINKGSVTSNPVTVLSSTMPVSLLNFDATININEARLQWSTASETNNDYFTIEKSRDAIHFETVATESGAGNSNALINYSADDNEPFQGVSYYRLKQTDFDGKYTYSNIVQVDFENSSDVSIYPNPFTTSTTIIISDVSQMTNCELRIYNVFGVEAMNTRLTNQSTTIDTTNLPAGTYFYKVIGNNETIQSGKLISQQ